jgi:hypothetical protein
MFEMVEKITDALKANKIYITFSSYLTENNSVLWWETLFSVGRTGKWLQPTLWNAFGTQSIGNPDSWVFRTVLVKI